MARAIAHEMAVPTSPRRAHWQAVVAEWRHSGLSQAEFCRRRGILPGTLAFWKHTLTWAGDPEASLAKRGRVARPTFVPVRVIARRPAPAATHPDGPRTGTGGAELAIVLRGDRHLGVRGQVDVQWLGQVVRMLEALGC